MVFRGFGDNEKYKMADPRWRLRRTKDLIPMGFGVIERKFEGNKYFCIINRVDKVLWAP